MKDYRRTLIILSVGNMSCSDIKIALFAIVISLKAYFLDGLKNLLHICIDLAALRELAPIAYGIKSPMGMRAANIDRLALCLARKLFKARSDYTYLKIGKADNVGTDHHYAALIAAANPHCAYCNRVMEACHFLSHLMSRYVIGLGLKIVRHRLFHGKADIKLIVCFIRDFYRLSLRQILRITFLGKSFTLAFCNFLHGACRKICYVHMFDLLETLFCFYIIISRHIDINKLIFYEFV